MITLLRIAVFILALAGQAFGAGPKLMLIVGDQAPALERRAAEWLEADLRALFGAETSIVTVRRPQLAQAAGDQVLLIGSPKTNAAIPAKDFPTVSAQGHV